MESKHIKSVKRPYRCSGKNKPLGFMLINNQHNDKLAVAHTFFASRGMLNDGPSSIADLLGIPSGMYPKPSVSDLNLAHSQYGPPLTQAHVSPILIPIKHPLTILRLVQRSGLRRHMVRITSFFSSPLLTKISATYALRPVFTCTKDPTTQPPSPHAPVPFQGLEPQLANAKYCQPPAGNYIEDIHI